MQQWHLDTPVRGNHGTSARWVRLGPWHLGTRVSRVLGTRVPRGTWHLGKRVPRVLGASALGCHGGLGTSAFGVPRGIGASVTRKFAFMKHMKMDLMVSTLVSQSKKCLTNVFLFKYYSNGGLCRCMIRLPILISVGVCGMDFQSALWGGRCLPTPLGIVMDASMTRSPEVGMPWHGCELSWDFEVAYLTPLCHDAKPTLCLLERHVRSGGHSVGIALVLAECNVAGQGGAMFKLGVSC